ncbi:hypothetical protein O6H91_03G095700 [Diphasiastrum complanatum]|uniref:Uncharacterized protein n=1 Tax=Diphasiastrum complanatum TaxID=34168 RepID=A0ACC2E9W3_DIPCM|nr:hypothetical protein O6H91_03G095700 [Diphasiastrum complanatum]
MRRRIVGFPWLQEEHLPYTVKHQIQGGQKLRREKREFHPDRDFQLRGVINRGVVSIAGFNCAEAVNFATADWLPHGSFAVDRYRFYHKEAVLSHDELLCVVAKNKCSSKTLEWLRLELTRVISTERCERERLWQHGTIKSSRMTPRARPQHIGDEEDQECIICRYYLHLSAVVCSCRPEKAVCLQHARQLCECSADKQQLLYRYSIAELEDLLKLENEVLEDCKSEDVSSDCRNHRPRIYEEQCGVRPLNTDAMKKVKGRSVRFTELAESWLSQARVETRTSPLLSVVNDLLGQAEQFLWAGHEMDLVRCMTKVLETSSVWGNDIANCYHAIEDQACGSNGQRSKVSLSWVQELVAVDPLPCMESCLPMLKVKVQEACDLQQQILSSLSASPPSEVRALQLLQKMAASSPFTYPEMQQLNEVLISAQFWSERLQKILSTGNIHSNCGGTSNVADIYQLRHLQSEGAQMPVIVPEKKLLDVVIKKVEVWQHHANQLLDSTAPLQEVEEAVKEAEDLPIYVAEAELLKKRIAEAESWIKRAASATDDSHTHSDYAASTRILKDLLLESRSLKVEVDEVTSLEKEIDRLSWMEKASKALNIKASTSYLVELTEESAKLNLEGELFSKVCKAAEDGLAWEAKAKSVLEFGACYEEFTELISSSAKINVKLSGWDDVKGAIHQSDLWLERANPFLRMHRNRNVLASTLNLQLSTLQELVIEAEFLPVLLGEAGLLRTSLIEAEAWCHKAAELEASMWSMLLCVHDTKHKQMSSENILVLDGENDITLKIQQQLSRLEELFSEGLSFGLEMPQLLKLKSLASTSRWTIKALRALSMSATMQEMESLVAEGKHLVVDLNICTMLETAIARAQDWLGKSVPILANFFSGTRVSKHLLEELLTESQAIPISLYSEVSQIKGILEAHWGWVRQVQNASDLNSTPLSSSDLFLLLEKGEADLVESEDTNFLRLKIEEACAWLKKCRQAIVSSSVDSRLSLKQLLLMLQSSLERTLELLEKVDCDRFKGIKQPACICQTPPTGPNSCLLCCDSCKDWYHPSCLGLTQFQPRTQKHFMCPFCSAVSTGVFSVKEHGLETYFSQRPAIFLLLELLDDSKEIHFRLEEKELLEKIIVSVHLWQTQVRKIVAPGLPQYSKSTVADISFLLAALKGVGRIEVEEEEKARVKLEIAVNAWHIRTKKMLDAPGKPQLRAICRALKEALSVQVPCEDKVLQDIKQRELYASRWVAHAKEVINDHGEMPVDEVQMLIAKGEELPVALTKELAALRERSVLYCVCQKPYDGDRAMIACDRCGEWYHFTCIDLPEPDSSDEDCEDAIQEELTPSGEFFCPNCRKSQRTEHLRLIDDIASERETPHSVVCTTQKHGDLPRLSSVRGKRTNRSMNKGEAMLRQEWSSELLSSGSLHWDLNTSVEGQDQSESCVNANGRPCRRTAGRHSRFESFVMLMRSR